MQTNLKNVKAMGGFSNNARMSTPLLLLSSCFLSMHVHVNLNRLSPKECDP